MPPQDSPDTSALTSGSGQQQQQTQNHRAIINIKAPPFCPERPALWFAQLEAQFHVHNVTVELDKFSIAIAHISTHHAAEVAELIITPPTYQPYSSVKNALISRFSKSNEAKLKQLLDGESIGDRTPSSFLRHLKGLVPSVDRDVLRAKWSAALPEQTRVLLATQSTSSLDQQAVLADKLHEIYHKPLIHVFKQSNERATPWQFRRLDFIAQFASDIRHVPGQDNVVADTLSRVDATSCPPSLQELAAAQANDNELKQLLKSNASSLSFSPIKFPPYDIILYCDVGAGLVRPFVPEPLRKQIFYSLHNLSHPGVRASRKLVTSRYVWPKMNRDCGNFAKSCLACQKNKIQRHSLSPIASFALPTQRFEHIHVDLVTMPVSKGFIALLTIIDRFTRFPEVVPIQDTSAETVARALIFNWIARYGVPLRITSDRGGQFESALFKCLASFFGIHHLRTTPYHPQCNGLVERLHRQLKSSLLCHNDAWYDVLPAVLLGLRSCFKEDINAGCALNRSDSR